MSPETKINPVESCRWHDPDFLNRSAQVVSVGRGILGPTALTNSNTISAADNEAIDRFFEALTPDPLIYPELSNWDNRGGLVEHCYFAGEIAYKLVLAVNEKTGTDIDPYAQKAALKLHDLGRTAIHSFMETDELTDIYWEQIGLREDLKDMTHNAHLYWDEGDIDFDSLSLSKRISILSDIFGKRSSQEPDRLRHKEEILASVLTGKKKYLTRENPTKYEQELPNRLSSMSQKEQYVITNTLNWLEEIGIDIDEVVDQVIGEYRVEETSS